MLGDVAREGCREAVPHGGCSMLAVEVMRGAWMILSMAVSWLSFFSLGSKVSH